MRPQIYYRFWIILAAQFVVFTECNTVVITTTPKQPQIRHSSLYASTTTTTTTTTTTQSSGHYEPPTPQKPAEAFADIPNGTDAPNIAATDKNPTATDRQQHIEYSSSPPAAPAVVSDRDTVANAATADAPRHHHNIRRHTTLTAAAYRSDTAAAANDDNYYYAGVGGRQRSQPPHSAASAESGTGGPRHWQSNDVEGGGDKEFHLDAFQPPPPPFDVDDDNDDGDNDNDYAPQRRRRRAAITAAVAPRREYYESGQPESVGQRPQIDELHAVAGVSGAAGAVVDQSQIETSPPMPLLPIASPSMSPPAAAAHSSSSATPPSEDDALAQHKRQQQQQHKHWAHRQVTSGTYNHHPTPPNDDGNDDSSTLRPPQHSGSDGSAAVRRDLRGLSVRPIDDDDSSSSSSSGTPAFQSRSSIARTIESPPPVPSSSAAIHNDQPTTTPATGYNFVANDAAAAAAGAANDAAIVVVETSDDASSAALSYDDAIDIDDLSAIKPGYSSNEQIIILSSGDYGDDKAARARRRSASASSNAAAASRAPVKPTTVRRRSAATAAAAAAAAGTASAAAASASDADDVDDPKVLPLRPIIRGPYDDDDDMAVHQGEMTVVYAEPHTEVQLNCDVDLDVVSTAWLKDGQLVQTTDRNSRPTDNRFIREVRGGLTITNAMLEDDGKWLCKAENAQGYVENARPVKLVVLDRPKAPYLLIDSRRLDAGNIFVPVKENSELTLACISEGGNPKPSLTWEVLLSPGVDRHTQKTSAETLELQEIRNEKDKDGIAVKSEAKLSAVYRAHHNARILCVMEHPTLKMRLNASILLDVQYTPSFAISRTPGFGYPLREGLEVSLKCDVDSNPPSSPMWQKDAGDSPVPQTGDGFLNFTSIRRENSGWYKCSSRHLNFQYSSIGYYLSVRYDSVDVTSEPLEQDISMAASHITPNKRPQLEVQLGGAVTLQCPQGSLGCWSHLDPVTAKLRGLGMGLTTPTGQFSLKDVVYQDAGVYKCIGQTASNTKKKVEVIHTIAVQVKGAPTVSTRNNTPVAYAGAPLHLSVEFCANPAAFAARWLHGDRIYTPGNQYGIDVLAYGVIDMPTPFCKEARLTYVHMHERVPRTFYFVVSSPGGVAETIFNVNFTHKHKVMSNSVDDDDEELSEPEEIHFPVFGSGARRTSSGYPILIPMLLLLLGAIANVVLPSMAAGLVRTTTTTTAA